MKGYIRWTDKVRLSSCEQRPCEPKGAKIRKYEIDQPESRVLHMIDEMTVHKSYGSCWTVDFLNKNEYRSNGGGKFTSIKVKHILCDPFYGGRLTTIRYRDSYTRADGTIYSVNEIMQCLLSQEQQTLSV